MLRMWISWHVFLDFLALSHWICVRFCLWKQTVVRADASRNLWRNNISFIFVCNRVCFLWLMKKKPDKSQIVHTIQCGCGCVHMYVASIRSSLTVTGRLCFGFRKQGWGREQCFICCYRFGCQGVCVHVCACPDLILLHLQLKDQFEFELFWKLKLLNNFILVGVGLDQ